jgi:hypothetical protein
VSRLVPWSELIIDISSSHLKHVVRRYGTTQTLERQFTYGLRRRPPVERRAHFAIDQDLTVARLRAKTGREIDHGLDRAVLRAALETNSAKGGISVCYADSKTELVSFTPPVCTENLVRVDEVMESPKLAE